MALNLLQWKLNQRRDRYVIEFTPKSYIKSFRKYNKQLGGSLKGPAKPDSILERIETACSKNLCKVIDSNSDNPGVIIIGTHFSQNQTKEEESIADFIKLSVAHYDRIFFSHSKEGHIEKYDPLSPNYIRSIADELRENVVRLHGVGDTTPHCQALQQANALLREYYLFDPTAEIPELRNAYQALERIFLESRHGLLSNMDVAKKNYLIMPAMILIMGETIPLLKKNSLDYCIVTHE